MGKLTKNFTKEVRRPVFDLAAKIRQDGLEDEDFSEILNRTQKTDQVEWFKRNFKNDHELKEFIQTAKLLAQYDKTRHRSEKDINVDDVLISDLERRRYDNIGRTHQKAWATKHKKKTFEHRQKSLLRQQLVISRLSSSRADVSSIIRRIGDLAADQSGQQTDTKVSTFFDNVIQQVEDIEEKRSDAEKKIAIQKLKDDVKRIEKSLSPVQIPDGWELVSDQSALGEYVYVDIMMDDGSTESVMITGNQDNIGADEYRVNTQKPHEQSFVINRNRIIKKIPPKVKTPEPTPPPKEPTPPPKKTTPTPKSPTPKSPTPEPAPDGYEYNAGDLTINNYYYFVDDDGDLVRGLYSGEIIDGNYVLISGTTRFGVNKFKLLSQISPPHEEKQSEVSDQPISPSDVTPAQAKIFAKPPDGYQHVQDFDGLQIGTLISYRSTSDGNIHQGTVIEIPKQGTLKILDNGVSVTLNRQTVFEKKRA